MNRPGTWFSHWRTEFSAHSCTLNGTESVEEPAVAVIVVVPDRRKVVRPVSSIVAALGGEAVHVIVGLVIVPWASADIIESCSESPIFGEGIVWGRGMI